uniref:Predicted nucleic acid-binding protein, contains PIN domain n=1 Tax=Candidatus Kentrum sp. SD TaxID=2126332 RepID=A0A450Y7H8_9GAMM|nr:MAG: Predicted nucleic acid-binding protein, contains PIN domain [Candidatus Kentron sp. SD]VFK42225.1 MAG: Predicted nucleic acid-binding protein, contains PIN domain [Candidatus Kentron sp. SD]
MLAYAFDNRKPGKRQIAQSLLNTFGSAGNLTLSTQVLPEFLVAVTRKLTPPLSSQTAYEFVENLTYYPLVQIEAALILSAIQRHRQLSVSFWDALIIEAVLLSNCTIVLSEDMQNGQRIDNKWTIRNPFISTR